MQGSQIELALRVLVYLNAGQKINHWVFGTEADFELYCKADQVDQSIKFST